MIAETFDSLIPKPPEFLLDLTNEIARIAVPYGVAILDHTCRLLVANGRARGYILERDGFEVLDGRLQIVHPGQNRSFIEMVRLATKDNISRQANAVGVLSRKSVGNRFAVRVATCSRQSDPSVVIDLRKFAMVVIADLVRHPDKGAIESLLDLPARQAEATYLFARGLSHQEISAEMAVEPITVSGHLNRVCERLGCENMADMARKIARLP